MPNYRKVKRVIKRGIKARYVPKVKGKRTLNIRNVAKDLMAMKRLLNVEKKFIDQVYTQSKVSQLSVLGPAITESGSIMLDITPQISQGIDASTRNGNSIKLSGASMIFQVMGNTGQIGQCKMILDIFQITTPVPLNSTTMAQIYNKNPFFISGPIYDTSVLRNINYFKTFKKVITKYITLPSEQISTSNPAVYVNVNLKLKQHLKFDAPGTSPIPTNTQYIMVMRADQGNRATTGVYSGTDKFTNIAFNSGILIQSQMKWWYVDN